VKSGTVAYPPIGIGILAAVFACVAMLAGTILVFLGGFFLILAALGAQTADDALGDLVVISVPAIAISATLIYGLLGLKPWAWGSAVLAAVLATLAGAYGVAGGDGFTMGAFNIDYFPIEVTLWNDVVISVGVEFALLGGGLIYLVYLWMPHVRAAFFGRSCDSPPPNVIHAS
jgi:hypothetical protein